MNTGVFMVIAITGFTVAFLHAAIPTHWLPFVVAARAQHWNSAKTLVVTGIAGSGHVLFTTALGVVVAWGGIAINAKWSRTFPLIAGGALIVVGLFSPPYHDSRAVTVMCICLAGLVIMSGTSITMMLIYTGIMRTMTLITSSRTRRNRKDRASMVAAKVGLGGDRRPCRAAYILAMRSIPAGFPDWRKIRLVRLCIA